MILYCIYIMLQVFMLISIDTYCYIYTHIYNLNISEVKKELHSEYSKSKVHRESEGQEKLMM